MPFIQNFYGPVDSNTSIENFNGTLTVNGRQVLSAQSDASDLAGQLKNLTAAIQALADVNADVKAKVTNELRAAEQEAKSHDPKGRTVKEHLDVASETLKSASETTSSAFSLAKILLEVGKWAVAILA